MKTEPLSSKQIASLQARYRALATQLGTFEALSQGSVMPQPPRAWKWTRKVRGKTVTLGLSAEKARRMKQAIANYRVLETLIGEMREITQKLILESPESAPIPLRVRRPKQALT